MATEHFTSAELCCRCGCGGLPTFEFQFALELLRRRYGRPMRISSGYRCPAYNDAQSTTGRNGPHTVGAVDVLISGSDAWDLIRAAMDLGWYGLGVRQHGDIGERFVHLDRLESGPRPWIWSYPDKRGAR